MSATLAVFTKHLLVVGGRAVRMLPPGALAEIAPKRVPRIREGNTFFILVTPTPATHAPADFFEKLAQLGADVYFGSGGGVTGGLREALTAINQQVLADSTPDAKKEVNALALGLHGNELYAARSGCAFGVLQHGTELTFFPAERRDALAMNLPPLGSGPAPEIPLTRYTVAPGQTMLLADVHLAKTTDDVLLAALSSASVPGVIDALKQLPGAQLSVSVIRFVAPGTLDPGNLAPPVSLRVPRVMPSSPVASIAITDVTSLDGKQESSVPVGADLVPDPLPSATHTPPDTPGVETLSAAPDIPPLAEERPNVDDVILSADEAESPISSRIGMLFGKLSGPKKPPSPDATQRTASLQKIGTRIKQQGRSALRTLLAGLLTVTDLLADILNKILPAPNEEGKQGIPTNIAVGLAVLIPFVIVIVVVGLALSQQGKTDFEIYLERAQSAHQEAKTLSGEGCENYKLRPQWAETLRLAEQASQYRPNDLSVLELQADARNYLDCFDGVQRRNMTLLHEFAVDAELVGPIVNGGVDLFTLDRQNGKIYHDTLTETGNSLTTRDNDPIIWRGQIVSSATGNYTVDNLLDMDWLGSGGTTHDNVLVALDRNGVLVAYSPTFFVTAQQLVIADRWQNPVAFTVFRANLYVLDTHANQIWRYTPPAGERRYSNAPEDYFNGEELPHLLHAVDLGISNEGAIYVLFDDGRIKKYRRNIQGIVEEQPFNYKEHPPDAFSNGHTLFMDNDPASASLFVVDAENETLYETSWSGRFNRGYRPRNIPDAFQNISGFYADAVGRNNMYVVAGNKLYHFNRTP